MGTIMSDPEQGRFLWVQELKDQLKNARVQHRGHTHDSEELLKIHTDLVTFHGDVVLMESYSALNYMGKAGNQILFGFSVSTQQVLYPTHCSQLSCNILVNPTSLGRAVMLVPL